MPGDAPTLNALDHLVLTVSSLERSIAFYRDVLGMEARQFGHADGKPRWALHFGVQKINLHLAGQEFDPKAQNPEPGSADLCFLTQTPLTLWQAHLAQSGFPVELGPISRTGATTSITSLYLRDPDGNLIEIGCPAL